MWLLECQRGCPREWSWLPPCPASLGAGDIGCFHPALSPAWPGGCRAAGAAGVGRAAPLLSPESLVQDTTRTFLPGWGQQPGNAGARPAGRRARSAPFFLAPGLGAASASSAPTLCGLRPAGGKEWALSPPARQEAALGGHLSQPLCPEWQGGARPGPAAGLCGKPGCLPAQARPVSQEVARWEQLPRFTPSGATGLTLTLAPCEPGVWPRPARAQRPRRAPAGLRALPSRKNRL